MKKILLFALISTSCLAQDIKRNSINVGLLGNNPVVATNYARKFALSKNQRSFFEVGLGIETFLPLAVLFAGNTSNGFFLPIYFAPHHVTYNIGKNSNFLELGYAGFFQIGSNQVLPGLRLGYRKETKKHFQYKIYTNPICLGQVVIWPPSLIGLSFGKTF